MKVPKQKTISLRELFVHLQRQMVETLTTNRKVIVHSGSKGEASELHWLKLLNDYLPIRYRADKAFVVDSRGNLSQQIDVVIYDRQYSPFLFNQDGTKYIPAESVYGVFEAKQKVDKRHIDYAREKAASVRRLRRTSVVIPHAGGRFKPKRPARILAGILALESSFSDPFGTSFKATLIDAPEVERLDLGCALQQGAFEANYDRKGHLSLHTSDPDTSLIFFFLRLLGRLQESGTVAALDFGTYEQSLGKQR